MPPRNIAIIFIAVIFSIVCYAHALRNHYAGLFSEAMHIVESEHLEQVSDRELFVSAMNGMVGSLDEHSMFMTDQDYSDFNETIDQRFGGVGIYVGSDEEDRYIMVEMPFFNSPAFKAGLQSGDLITSVDGISTERQKRSDVVNLMRGHEGDPVTLGIRRPLEDGKFDEFEVTIVRERIKIPSVKGDKFNADGKWEFVLQEDPRIGFIRLMQFGKDSSDELRAALEQMPDNIEGLILDLRYNPGGSLDSAIDICDMFIDSGAIVSTRGRDKKVKELINAKSGTVIAKDIPMVVLINEGSASASEIVSACLQDHGRALIVGERSYGKGTVQNVIELESGRSLLKLTTASFWRPSGRNIHKLSDAKDEDDWGVTPDEGFRIPVEQEEMIKILKYRQARDFENQKEATQNAEKSEKVDDPQLRKAIDYLQRQISLPKAA